MAALTAVLLVRGSPPRVRGTGVHIVYVKVRVRITPACAGNSDSFCHFPFNGKDHPRVCGEQIVPVVAIEITAGSPPRVRGTELSQYIYDSLHRITPACAGNSILWRKRGIGETDHPRVCGEQKQLVPEGVQDKGSPPRVRGTEGGPMITREEARITPACAGNSPLAVARAAFAKDHPRVCGEQLYYRKANT